MEKINKFKKIIEKNKNLNFILSEINYNKNIQGPLSKYHYIIKDNISMKDTITTAGSAFLKNYNSPFDATVVKLLNNSGAKPIAKSNLDEFGLGGIGIFSAFGDVKNPYDNNRISGGSSSGSAVAMALNCCDFALGTDTGDSIRKPASYNGVIGYKPSYGLVSRFGVIPYSPSLDHVGVFVNKFSVLFDVMDVIAKKDENDFSSQDTKINFKFKNMDLSKLKICIINETYEDINEDVIKLFESALSLLPSKINKLNFGEDLIKIIPSLYQVLSYSEAVSCYQSFSGITFGEKNEKDNFEEIAKSTRTEYLGKEIKRRFTIGSYCTSSTNYEELFLNSKKVRTLINNRIKDILNENHFVISFGSSTVAPTFEEIRNKEYKDKNADNFLQIANFSGFPSITIPLGKINGMPIGINITSRLNTDNYLISFAKIFNDLIRKRGDHE